MLETIADLNLMTDEAAITEVRHTHVLSHLRFKVSQPSLMNFCVTDGESVVVTRYISSKKDEAASLVSALLTFSELLILF